MSLSESRMQSYSTVSFVYPLMFLMFLGLINAGGCGVDTTAILNGILNNGSSSSSSSSLSDLAGTWKGTLTAQNESTSFDYVVDDNGTFTAGGVISGTVAISSGAVTFTYSGAGYTYKLHGTLSSDNKTITMSTYSYSGTNSGTTTLTGSLTKSSSSTTTTNFLLTDLVGTWQGSLAENGRVQIYAFTVDSTGAFTTGGTLSGTAAITTGGTVVFTYTSGGYAGTFEGAMNSAKTKITMSKHTWTGTDNGTANCTGTLAKP